MKLLSDFPGASMDMGASEHLRSLLKENLSKEGTRYVLETGTYLGLGSTTFVSESFPKECPPKLFVTLESNWVSWRKAKQNLQAFPFVRPLWGKTMPQSRALQFLAQDEILRKHDEIPDIFIDNIKDPLQFYTREIQGKLGGRAQSPGTRIPQLIDRLVHYAGNNLLEKYLKQFRKLNPLIILDSCGGVGFLEFTILCDVMESHPYLVLLDDINHIKHFRSYRHIKEDPRFDLLGADESEGWLLAKYSPTTSN